MNKLDLSAFDFKLLRQVDGISYSRGTVPMQTNSAVVIARATTVDTRISKQLENEFSLASVLGAAWAIRPVDLVVSDDQPVLLYEDYQAEPLHRRFKGSCSLEFFFPLALQITALLKALHATSLLHRNINPDTLLIDQNGIIRLSGFGFAGPINGTKPALAAPVTNGSLAYISPEHTGLGATPVDYRSELYSAGVVLYELLTGRLPFELDETAEPQDWMHCHLVCDVKAPNILNLAIPAWLSKLILKLLEKDPAQRYQSAAALEADLLYCHKVWRETGDISPFPLGQFHASASLKIPDNLHLRQQEAEQLHSALHYSRVSKHKAVVFLTGAAGIGKSALLQAFISDLDTTRLCVAKGKAEQQTNVVPYITLIQAFRFCLKRLLKLPAPERNFWQQRLAKNLGSYLSKAINALPELASLCTVKQEGVIPAEPQDSTRLILLKLVQALTTTENPFVLVVDDIQWLDQASKHFLVQLMSETSFSPLTLILGGRDSEETTILRSALPQPNPAWLFELQLKPLDQAQITKIIAGMFQTTHPNMLNLATLILAKTLGNPFFVTQFLNTLVQKGLINRVPHTSSWHCNQKAIEAIAYTDNVADNILQHFLLFPSETQHLLIGMSCIGRQAEQHLLTDLFKLTNEEIQHRLLPALHNNVLHKTDTGYAFYHDLVHSAIKELISQEDICQFNLMIGRHLLKQAMSSTSDDKLFRALEHLSVATLLLTDPLERRHIMNCALTAANKAKSANAWQSALYFIRFADSLLSDNCENHKQILVALRLALAECEILTGRLEAVPAILAEALQMNVDKIHNAQVYQLNTELNLRRFAYQEAVNVALNGLQIFDYIISPAPTDNDCLKAYNRLKKRLGNDFRQCFIQLPLMADPQAEAITGLLAALSAPALFTNQNLHFIQLCHSLELALDYGISGIAASALGWYGVLISQKYGEYEAGMAYCQLSRSLVAKHQFIEYEAKVLLPLVRASVWTQPLSSAVDCANAVVFADVVHGDLAVACFAFCHQIANILSLGQPLDKVLAETHRGLTLSKKAAFDDIELILTVQQVFIDNLHLGKGNVFSGHNLMSAMPHLSEDELSKRMPTLVFLYWLYKGMSHYFAGEYQDAVTCLNKAGGYNWSVPAHIHLLDYHFFSAMSLMAAHTELSPGLRQQVLQHQQQINQWAELNPTNFADKAAILQAELWRFDGEILKAMGAFENITASYKNKDFIQNKALAYERAGRTALEHGQPTAAAAYLQQSILCYKEWSAQSKVKQLENLCIDAGIAELRGEIKQLPHSESANSYYLSNLLRASKAITEQVDYSTLLQVLLKIIVEQAGAQRVLLLKPQGDSLILEARANTTTTGVVFEALNSEANWDDLPKSFVNTAIRTQKLLYVKANQLSTPYELDPYFQRFCDFTALCLPMIRQGKLLAMFYIELKAKDEQLSEEYLNVLTFLAGHAAVSIETSRLYNSIENVNQQRLQLERALRVADTSLALGEQISRTGSWRWELHKNTLVCSEEFCRILGLDPQRRTILFAAFAACIHPDDKKSVLEQIHRAVQMETAIKVEYRILKDDGSILYLTGQGCPVFGTDKLIDYVGTVTDVTARRASEDALRAAQDDLARVSRVTTIGQLTSSIAHEINQPLMSIAANAGAGLRWLHRPTPDLQQVSASLQAIATEGQRAGQIVQSLRTLTKNSKAVLRALDMHDVLNCIVALARSEIERRDVSLVMHLDAQLSHIRGDIVQLQQVMLNLVMNALEAMSEVSNRQRVLTISTFTQEEQKIFITVEDTGPGINDEIKDRLFDAFYTTKKDGMGMGLAICHSVVDMHGGKLSAAARQPVGSVFSFFVPLVKD
ncbi:ATP-binding sensor histidine kinase [Rheinheimera oceanensis]|uniref:ATP-binding sensor histidine kinase n=1 Tax=Rheinheimera oceanensis TaxID=2817449 RepID=UPI001BFE8F8A|nr:ATP-binding sensor histidine kinase [Rheinheimera oceanensis]